MAYAKDFTTLTLAGTLAQGNEIWTCGLHLDSLVSPVAPGDWEEVYTARAQEYADACSAFISDIDMKVPQDVLMNEVRLTHRGTDGKTIGEPIIVQTNARGGANNGYAPQNAMVNTLVSNKARAPGRYNRFYLPVSLNPQNEVYKMEPGAQAAYAARLQEFIDALNTIGTQDEDNTQFVNVVSSAGEGSSLGVTKVMVGQIVDTQQRRRNALNEAYVTLPVPAA